MGQGVEKTSAPKKSVSQSLHEAWAYYYVIGMTYDEYWYGDTDLVKFYRKVDLIKQKRENERCWLMGAYIYNAILCASPILHAFAKNGTKPIPYLDKPFPMNDEQSKEKGIEKRYNAFLNYLHKIAKKEKK